jgi:hypothetical protein
MHTCLQALMLGYKVATCQAPIPAETLPICGFGSGKKPPCWTERFTTAKVAHSNGEQIVYIREDGMASTSSRKGYRYWVRTDLEELRSLNAISIEHTVNQTGSAFSIYP